MKNFLLAAVAIAAVVVALTQGVSAADSGETRPRLNHAGLAGPGTTTADIIATTTGSGNVRGLNCIFTPNTVPVTMTIKFYVNGGAAQSITFGYSDFAADSNGNGTTGWIPLNVRFTSSIRVEMQRFAGPNDYSSFSNCFVSWALD